MKWRKRDNCNKKRTIDRRCTRFEEAVICLVSPLQLHPRSSRKGVEDSRASRDGFQRRLVSRAIATGPILTGMISVFERSWNLYLSPEHHPEIVLVVLSGDEEEGRLEIEAGVQWKYFLGCSPRPTSNASNWSCSPRPRFNPIQRVFFCKRILSIRWSDSKVRRPRSKWWFFLFFF